MTEFTQFNFEVDKGVALVTFNRPEKMNTFNPLVMTEMIRLFDVTDADDSIGAIVVTGSGKAFCAGAELGVAGGDTFNYNKRAASEEVIKNGIRRDGGGRVALRIFKSMKPVIAAVNGAAVGVGVTMLTASTLSPNSVSSSKTRAPHRRPTSSARSRFTSYTPANSTKPSFARPE